MATEVMMRRSVQTRLPAILKSRPLHQSILYHKRGMLSGYVRLDECHANLARSAMPILGVTTRPVMPIRHDAHRAQRRIRHSPALRNRPALRIRPQRPPGEPDRNCGLQIRQPCLVWPAVRINPRRVRRHGTRSGRGCSSRVSRRDGSPTRNLC